MKNYYEILEINEKASQEIIDKVYKILIKKYHPDLQEDIETKTKFEEKIKEINEAYEILGNPEKRSKYDKKLLQEKELAKQKQYESQASNTNSNAASTYNSVSSNISKEPIKTNQQRNYAEKLANNKKQDSQYQKAINKAYHDAYIQDMKNRGYKIKYKKTLNDRLRSLIALLITIGIIFLILQLPFVKNYLHKLYEENAIIHNIIDTLSHLF